MHGVRMLMKAATCKAVFWFLAPFCCVQMPVSMPCNSCLRRENLPPANADICSSSCYAHCFLPLIAPEKLPCARVTAWADAKETATGQFTHISGGKTSGGRMQPRLHGSQKPLSVEVWRASLLVIGSRRSPGLRH